MIVTKSEDGGNYWWGTYNVSSTPADPTTEVDDLAENSAHAGPGATNERVNVVYQMPKWDWNTTGDPDGPDHTCRLYAGFVEYTDEEKDYILSGQKSQSSAEEDNDNEYAPTTKELLSHKGETEINLLIKDKNHQALFSLQDNRKFDLNHFKALKAKKYVEKITV